MAALGDSITQALMTCSSLSGCPANRWSTGTARELARHTTRRSPPPARYNHSVSGAKSIDLPGQAATAVSQGAQYVTIEIGANDACTKTVATMTPRPTFQTNVAAAL